jgi:hexosaminidase
MMLDVSRHFFPADFVKRFIDFLVMHKMNRFHWHLTDDQGWRIEIPQYPRLTEISAWRADKEDLHWNARPPHQPGEPAAYGGFYRQEEIREIVRYASDRHVMVIPEIEMPAHVSAVLAAHPELSCTGGPFTVPTGGLWPITDIYCAGNDSTFSFLENVLAEVVKLFPGPYVHIGGDEANKKEWQRCPRCQERIRTEGLADEAELQSYFIRRIEQTLTRLGKRLIGWDEILEGGLPPQATVMSWRGIQGGIVAAREGHDVIMSPTSHCYFDYYQGTPDAEPLAIGGYLPLRTVYSYEPTPDSLTEKEARHILGAQANVWTEFVHDPAQAEYMIFPRIAAIAEVCWSPRMSRDWRGFTQRLGQQMERYQGAGMNAALSVYAVQATDSLDPATGNPVVTLQSELVGARIYYSLDGSAPTGSSSVYSAPMSIAGTASLRAAVMRDNDTMGPVLERSYTLNKARGANVTLARPFDAPFGNGGSAELVDNLRGTYNLRDRRWFGVRGSDLEAVLDLRTPTRVSRISAGFFHESAFGAFLPESLEVFVSDDGASYRLLARTDVTSVLQDPRPAARDVVLSVPPTDTRYVKVRASSRGPLPSWHRHAGTPTWLIIDEIIVE